MTTARDIVSAAMDIVGAKDLGRDAEAQDFVPCLAALNDLLHGFKLKGHDLYEHVTLEASDDMLLGPEYDGHLKYILAKRIAPIFGDTLSPEATRIAEHGENVIAGRLTTPLEMTTPGRELNSYRYSITGS